MTSLATIPLVGIFSVAVIATWVAGTSLARNTDVLDRRFGLGEALGGMVLLAIAGSLPELAITVSAAAKGNLDLAAGNLIGGIAVQTMVLVICDAVVEGERPLTYLVGSLVPVLEGALVILVAVGVLLGALLPRSIALGPVSPASLAIVVLWLGGILVLNRVRKAPLGATVLAVATALPEISSGVSAVRIGDHQLAMGDIFGGNAFQLCIFLLADLIAGRAVLPAAGDLNSWLAALGIALTAVFAAGVIARPSRRILRLGADSWVALVVFGLGIAGLLALPQ
ncbi:MAG: sodium:calcium antiporter [Actinobacteria bacterium]|nr:MAG: sodium:calcium antiporter [Actinomycetota bacterium]